MPPAPRYAPGSAPTIPRARLGRKSRGTPMRRHNLPEAPEARARAGVQSDISPKALEAWDPGVRAATDSDTDNTISIYDPIGYDWWTGEGVTAKRIAAALRAIGSENPVT